jgi:hypothetical protein
MPSKNDDSNADKKKDDHTNLFMNIIDNVKLEFEAPESFLDIDQEKCERFKSYLKKMCDYLKAENDLSSSSGLKTTVNGIDSVSLLPSELIVDKSLVDNEQIYQQLQLYNGDTLASLPSLSKFFAKCMLKLDTLKLSVDKGMIFDAKKKKKNGLGKSLVKEKINNNHDSEGPSSADDGDDDDDDEEDEYKSESDNEENLNLNQNDSNENEELREDDEEDKNDLNEDEKFDDDFDEAELEDDNEASDDGDQGDDVEEDDDDEYDYMFDDHLPGENDDANDPNAEYDLVGAEVDSGLYTGQLDNIEEINLKKQKIVQKPKNRIKNLFADENMSDDEEIDSKQAKSSLEIRQEKVIKIILTNL